MFISIDADICLEFILVPTFHPAAVGEKGLVGREDQGCWLGLSLPGFTSLGPIPWWLRGPFTCL